MDRRNSTLQVVLAFAAIYLVWGSTYLAIRFAIESIPPFLMAGMRFLVAGGALFLWARRGQPKPTLAQWRSAILIGIALLLFSNGGVTWAEQLVPSGIAALFVAAVPLWITLLEWLLYGGSRPGVAISSGLIVGFAGVLLLIGNPFAHHEGVDLRGVAALMIATFSWANGSLYSRKADLPSSQFLAASMEMLAGGVALTVVGFATGEYRAFHFASVSVQSWISLAYLSVFGSIVAFTAYIWLLQVTAPSRVATYAYVNPMIALLLGWGFGGETMSPRVFIAAGVIVFAVVLIITARSKSESVPEKAAPPIPRLQERLAKAACE